MIPKTTVETVVLLCDVESKTYCLATNVTQMSNEEVSDIYRQLS
jgi:hypothetical protein